MFTSLLVLTLSTGYTHEVVDDVVHTVCFIYIMIFSHVRFAVTRLLHTLKLENQKGKGNLE
jgi:hypothetical protein